jgi:hypothetical protein
LAEHTVNGEPICPGGAYIDMVMVVVTRQPSVADVPFRFSKPVPNRSGMLSS